MVWKVFAPRWMLAVVSVLVADVGALGVWMGVWRIGRVVERTFGKMLGRGG